MRDGFTLIELSLSTAVLAVVAGLVFIVMLASTQSVEVADAKALAQSNVRDVLAAMTPELMLAAKDDDGAVNPPVTGLRVTQNPAPPTGLVEVLFQTPLDGTGTNYSTTIRFRYINEDLNDNNVLDEGEDLDNDSTLTRRVLRMQDRNGDGDTADAGEAEPIGGANHLSDVQFVLNNDALTVTVEASVPFGERPEEPATARATSVVYLMN